MKRLTEVFQEIVGRFPDSIAVVHGHSTLSYAELNVRSNRLAHLLRERGVVNESLVGVCMERSPQMVIALLAIIKAGAAYVPLDPDYPPERLEFMLSDSGIRWLVGSAANPATFGAARDLVILDAGAESALYSDAAVAFDLDSGQLAYVIYTSGSTGKAKGACITRGSVLSLVNDANYVDFHDRPCIAQASNTSFDAATFEIWGALLNGGRVCIVEKQTLLDPAAFARQSAIEGIDTVFLTTALFNLYARCGSKVFSGLKRVLFGGEQVSVRAVDTVLSGDMPQHLLHVYGPTETTTFSSWAPLLRPRAPDAGVSIGTALTNVELYVLDQWLNMSPTSVVGELYIGGAGLARGYLHRPAMTGERFVANPFGQTAGERMYRTGDLVRWLPDGNLDFVARADLQIKLRGYRIEPKEIEAALLAIDGVRDAVVAAAGDDQQKFLVAHVATALAAITPDFLRTSLKSALPDYMVPARYVILGALPLTANGKVDREVLASLAYDLPAMTAPFVAASSAVERRLVECWKEALGVSVVGIHDNFFELGGDSLMALRVKAAAHALGVGFELVDAFEHQTIAELAAHTYEVGDDAAESAPFALVSEDDRVRLAPGIESAYPLAQMQMSMLFHSNFESDLSLYHVVLGARLTIAFSESDWRSTLAEIAGRHEILRTSLHLEGFSEPLQLVHATAAIPLCIADWRDLSPAEQRLRYRSWVIEESHQPFQYGCPPLLRVFIHRYSVEEFHFTLSFHHSIMDGWSDASLATELLQRYSARLGGAPLTVQRLRAHYRDYVALERAAMESESSRAYWAELIRGFKGSMPCIGRHDIAAAPPPSATHGDIIVSEAAAQRLAALAHQAKVPLKTLLLAAHLRALAVLCGQTDVMTGLVWNGRLETLDGDKALGLFLNTLPFRLLIRHETWLELVQRVFEHEKLALRHRRYPLPALMRDNQGLGAPEIVFNFTDFHVLKDVAAMLKPAADDEGAGAVSVPLQVSFWPTSTGIGGTISGALTEAGAKYTPQDLSWYAEVYSRTLAAMAGDPRAHVDQLAALNEVERRRLLVEWNATRRDVRSLTFPELFEERVRRAPNSSAVVFEGRSVSYADLNDAANRLSHSLIAAGVGPEDVVAVALPKGIDLVISLLAILKSGAAYLGLDPAYPPRRLSIMIDDATPRCVVSSASVASRLPLRVPPICIDDRIFMRELETRSSANPSNADRVRTLSASNPAYVIFTSGSTGTPKGVAITHSGVASLSASQIEGLKITPSSRILQFASISFDAAFWELCMSLLSGAALVLAPGERLLPGIALERLLAETGITHATLPPTALAVMRDTAVAPGVTLIAAGESCPAGLVETWTRQHVLINAYGPTETTVCATMTRPLFADLDAPPIGRPVLNTQIHVLDAFLQPVPVGVPGELYVSGEGLARGYLKRPGLTAERFIANPFGPAGSRCYRTGDLVRWLPGGSLDFLGRTDHQIKIRGFRVEPREIEACLLRHAGVSQASVLAREGAAGQQLLIAYVASANADFDVGAARRALAEQLPNYMVPAAVILLAELPLTANGKLDRDALPALNLAASMTRHAPPATELEMQIAQLWHAVLGGESPGIHDDFFAVGGDSLTALTFAARLQALLSRPVPIALIFTHRTIAGMGHALHASSAAEPAKGIAIVLQAGNESSPKLFLVPPGSGDSACYSALARSFGVEFTVLGFERAELSSGVAPRLMPLSEIAAEYLQALQRIQPQGPYLLAGWSMGGVIAFEMAAQLRDRSEQVYVGIIDSQFPALSAANAAEEATALRLLQLPDGDELQSELRAFEAAFTMADIMERPAAGPLFTPDAAVAERLGAYRRMHLVQTIALYAHRPVGPSDGIFYFAADRERSHPLPRARAAQFVAQRTLDQSTHLIDAAHDSILQEPAAAIVASMLSRSLLGLTGSQRAPQHEATLQ